MLKRLEILLVEDHADSALALASLLRAGGSSVAVADSCAAAKSLYGEKSFDVLLCDLGLPDGDGCDLLRELIAIRRVCAIAITGFGMEEDVERSKAAGFVAHLTKPITLDSLRQTLERVFTDELCLSSTHEPPSWQRLSRGGK